MLYIYVTHWDLEGVPKRWYAQIRCFGMCAIVKQSYSHSHLAVKGACW